LTKQITLKLNYNQFRPLLDELAKFAGKGMSDSDSDLAAKALFYAYRSFTKKHPELGKTTFDITTEARNISRSEALLEFLNDYHRFKKEGINPQFGNARNSRNNTKKGCKE
jgi:hypothetical protein